jgi:hypothetical protein
MRHGSRWVASASGLISISVLAVALVACAAAQAPGERTGSRRVSQSAASPSRHPATSADGDRPPVRRLPPCRRVRVVPGEHLAPMSNESIATFDINVVGTRPCSMKGYPTVQLLLASGQPAYGVRTRDGRGIWVSRSKPHSRVLSAQHHLVFIVAKPQCTLGPGQMITSARITFTGAHAAYNVAATDGHNTYGLTLCHGGERNPANMADISPITRTLAKAATTN